MNMIEKEKQVKFIPPVPESGWIGQAKPTHGWLQVDGKIHCITDIHNFDDFGVEQDTLTLDDGSEWITQDGGSTFREN
tara:strand:- start:2098 stop:2331 length:234 start_codon:yes stop_codon:yes gene_type:complete